MKVSPLAAALGAALSASSALAHLARGVPGHQILKRHHDLAATPAFAKRASAHAAQPSNDLSWQKVHGENAECNGYNDPVVAAFTNEFPANWDIADIMPGDTEAQAAWTKIFNSGTIPPHIKPKGLPSNSAAGNGTSYNEDTDPDCWWTATTCTTPKNPGIPADVVACPEPETWGLTFDDGPNCTHNAFYDYLKANNQKATMFYIGSNVMNWPWQAQRGLTDGHQISAHTWSHHYMTSLSDTQVFAELYYTVKAIKYVVGVTVTSWRPPYGDVDDRVRAIAAGLGLETIVWTDDTNDWNIAPDGDDSVAKIDSNYAKIISKSKTPALSKGGIVVLTHEIDIYTMQEFQKEYPKIKSAFKHIMPVDTCRNKTQVYQEPNIVYPNFSQYAGGSRMPTGIPSANAIKAASTSYTVAALMPSTSAGSASATSPSGSNVPGAVGVAQKGSSESPSAKSGAASGVLAGSGYAMAVGAALAGGAGAFVLGL